MPPTDKPPGAFHSQPIEPHAGGNKLLLLVNRELHQSLRGDLPAGFLLRGGPTVHVKASDPPTEGVL